VTTSLHYPLSSLASGCWFKLICGASFQDLPAIRNLTLTYALAGADCIDVAADPVVIRVAQEALALAQRLAQGKQGDYWQGKPWLMVSLSDGADPHFRKAVFDPALCPPTCPRPCEGICPTQAISFGDGEAGVNEQRCYGCGRCLPICPLEHIGTRTTVVSPSAIAPLMLTGEVNALEIHTQVGRLGTFQRLWQAIKPGLARLDLVAVSCPDGVDLETYLWSLYEVMTPLPCPLIWQADGRPMSGDIGKGTTHATIRLAQKLLATELPGVVQLAGGTNHYTVPKLRDLGLLRSQEANPDSLHGGDRPTIIGVAYGSYARTLLDPILKTMETLAPGQGSLEASPALLAQAVARARSLVTQLKSGKTPATTNTAS